MWNRERVVRELRSRGELWECAPGLIGLRGEALALRDELAAALRAVSFASASDEWRLPPALPLRTLERAEYFASFPHWLTTAAHLDDDEDVLRAVAEAGEYALPDALAAAMTPARVALQPAVCYHVHAALEGRRLDGEVCITCEGTCWRHEGAALRPLERGWAFTMREVVCAGDTAAVAMMLATQRAAAAALAAGLGLEADFEPAEDPFFAPTARGRALIQRLQGLKDELRMPIGGGSTVAVASFNRHEAHFSTAFDIALADGDAAVTGCAAYGIERWLLAVLVAHGVDSAHWPDVARVVRGIAAGPLLRAVRQAVAREATTALAASGAATHSDSLVTAAAAAEGAG